MNMKQRKYRMACIDCVDEREVSYTTYLETNKGLRDGRCQSCAEIHKRCMSCKTKTTDLTEFKDVERGRKDRVGFRVCESCIPKLNQEVWQPAK